MSNIRAILFLAIKDVFKDKKIFGLVVMILAASYINLVFFTSILNGFTNTFQDQLIDLMTSHITLKPKEGHKYIDSADSVAKKVELVPGIIAVATRLSDAGVVSYKSKTVNAPIDGIDPSKEGRVTILESKVVDGEFLNDGDTDQVLLGSELIEGAGEHEGMGAATLGSVSVGDRITIAYSNGIVKSYRVKGVVKTSGGFSDFSVFVTNKEIESILGLKDKATSMLVRTSDKSESSRFKLLIMEQNIAAIPETWQENAGFIDQIKSGFEMVIAATTLVSLLTAAMTIGIIIYINTIHKRRVIGILKAIGTKNSAILKMFLIESVIFGLFGIIIGIVLGNVMLAYFEANPMDLAFGPVIPELKNEDATNAALSLLATVIIAGIYPAYSAARANIVKSIFGA